MLFGASPSGSAQGAWKFTVLCLAFEVMLVLLYAFTADYSEGSSAQAGTSSALDGGISAYYPMYQDVHVMIFIGFGMLMTFLSRYSWSAVGLNFLLSALAVQWTLLTIPFFVMAEKRKFSIVTFDITGLIDADFAAGSLMISFGAVLGRTSATQLVVMTFFHGIVFGIEYAMIYKRLKAVDMGGSLVIHLFGAVFGLTVSWMLGGPRPSQNGKTPAPAYTKWSTTGSMVGTLFLWCFWPSFNGAFAHGAQQHRVVINTLVAIAGSCVFALVLSRALRPSRKFDFEDLANATLSGGVAVGCAADLVIKPWGALLVGLVAGALSTWGFVYVTAFLSRYCGIHDTCGVANLHGMPGFLGGVAGAVSAGVAGGSSYGTSIGVLFPARAPSDPIAAAALGVPPGSDRSALTQGGYQFAAILVAIAFAIAGGLVTGAIMRLPVCDPMTSDLYDDKWDWTTEHIEDQTYATVVHDEEQADNTSKSAHTQAHAIAPSDASSSSAASAACAPADERGVELTAGAAAAPSLAV